MEKAIAHPTDARLCEKARQRLVTLAQEAALSLRQSYARLAPRLSGQVGRYAHARQFKRIRKALRRLKGYTDRVMRDIQRQMGGGADDQLRQRIEVEIALADRLLRQKPKDKSKLYALHEPAVDCISKGKARVRYEFGTKVSVATTHKEGFAVGMRSMPGNPYDGHTLCEALEQVEILTEIRPKRAFVDRGYRGHGVQTTAVYIAGQMRGWTPALQHDLRRRSAIEPMIGHMKTDGRLSRCALKGTLGDALHALLCGCGDNIRMILAHIRALWVESLATLTCIDPVKICSCYREENSDEYDDGRQHQAVDGEAEDGAGHRDHSRQDDGGGSQPFLRSVTL